MRDSLETYKIWAPEDSVWAQWAKPVLFIHQPIKSNLRIEIPNLTGKLTTDNHTMIIVDLPSHNGVMEGLALACLGYRPVPLYNGVDGPSSSMVKVTDITRALFEGAEELIACSIRSDAPPVFLLDSNRMTLGGKRSGTYDNRWCVFPQDMPSASFLSQKGITKIILRSDSIRNDLSHILLRYQEQGIDIYLSNENEVEKKINVVKPSRYKSLSYRCLTILGLTRNSAGGFGAMIPEPTQSSSRRYYGFG